MVIGFKTKNSEYSLRYDENGKITGVKGGKYLKDYADTVGSPVIIIGAPARFEMANGDVLRTSTVQSYVFP